VLFGLSLLYVINNFQSLNFQSAASSQGVLITSFGGLVTNKEDLIRHNFDYIILDEGHKIRNPDAQITLAVKKFPTCHRIILSG
jgi:DNA excision repair protein ERCC-6